MVDLDLEFVSPVPMGETFVQSEPLPLDHRRVVAAVCCLLVGRRCGCEAQCQQALVAQGNRRSSGHDFTDRRGAAVAVASTVACGSPAFRQPLRFPRMDRRRPVPVWLRLGNQRAVAARTQLGPADVSPRAARTGHKWAVRAHSSSDLHGTGSSDDRFRDWHKHFLGAAGGPCRRVLHL